MASGGRAHGISRSPRALRVAAKGLGLTLILAAVPSLGASVASGVSSRVPTAKPNGTFVFGKPSVRPDVTRRVVATQSHGAEPLGLLFRIASGQPATPTHVLGAAPIATEAPAVPAPNPIPVGVPPVGKASVWGCAAAIAYLNAHAAPGFSIQCPGDAGGHQATTTCISGVRLCSLGASIVIADPCPAAYMNEASNSWVLIGVWRVPVDPFGSCP
jgi:hypothetical protein